jgi:hypothetical protein
MPANRPVTTNKSETRLIIIAVLVVTWAHQVNCLREYSFGRKDIDVAGNTRSAKPFRLRRSFRLHRTLPFATGIPPTLAAAVAWRRADPSRASGPLGDDFSGRTSPPEVYPALFNRRFARRERRRMETDVAIVGPGNPGFAQTPFDSPGFAA